MLKYKEKSMNRMNIMNKKGEMTTTQIITFIILIVGFAIIIFVLWQIGFSGRIDRDTCHTSVVFRATLPSIGGAQEYVPLKCQTQKYCITSGLIGGNCEEDYGSLKG